MIGEYRLRARLGSGGMGQVYLGLSPAGRAVAVKVVHPELARDAEFLRRFRQEVASARAVSGIYTAAVVAAGLDQRPPWLATAFVPGPSLSQVIAVHGPLDEPALWPLFAGLVEALQAIHVCGVVHRDLKPGNVLLAGDGPRVIDFGISRASDGTALTATGLVFGTPGYMSPEQAEGKPAGPASDVFALGAVVAYAATGCEPFGAGTAASVLYRVVHTEPDLNQVPPRLRGLVAACLAKDPAARPVLPALASAIAAGTQDTGPSGMSFWPRSIASLIGSYQASLDAQASAGAAAAGTGGPIGAVPAGDRHLPAEPSPPPAGAATGLGAAGQLAYPATQTYAGPQGYPGPQGSTGPQGYPGPLGSAGPQGYPAPQAYPGPPGSPGPQGYPAPPGSPGPQGYRDPQGYPGSPGGVEPAPPRGYLPGGAGYPQPAQPAPAAWASPAGRPACPASVRTAARFMYAGAVIALLSGLRDLVATAGEGDYVEQRVFGSTHFVSRDTAFAYVTIGFVVQIALWIGLARASKSGKDWARIAATVCFGFLTVGLLSGFQQGDASGVILAVPGWLVGLGAFVLLWRRKSREFFNAVRGTGKSG